MKMNGYQKLAIATVIATLVLIFVGGLVRASGSGLGCPDWPTCFGMWIPPTSAEGLPAGYDASQFNAFHTWMEYVNRLTGVLIGMLITATFIFSFRYRKSDPVITITSGVAFILVLFQGWLGGRVVASGLSAGLITLHMFLAMIIVNVLLYNAFRVAGKNLRFNLSETTRRSLMTVLVVLLVLTLFQLAVGTQVREQIDVIKNVPEPPPRESWLELAEGWIYPFHRSFSWLIVIATGLLFWIQNRYDVPSLLKRTGYTVIVLVIFQILAGVGLDWLHMPGLLQVLHLTGAALLICAVFLYLLLIRSSRWSGAT